MHSQPTRARRTGWANLHEMGARENFRNTGYFHFASLSLREREAPVGMTTVGVIVPLVLTRSSTFFRGARRRRAARQRSPACPEKSRRLEASCRLRRRG